MRLKPTTLIALDSHAAAFCDAVHSGMAPDEDSHDRLVQAHAVVVNNEGVLNFSSRVRSAADVRFNLVAARTERQDKQAVNGTELVERESSKLEALLINEFGAGRQTEQIQNARRSGIEIVRHRMIYLVLSAADPTARSLVLPLARLIRWLYVTRFAQDLYNLHAVIMLPGLFNDAQPEDHAETYALLKTIDHAFTNGIIVTAQQRMPPFDFCWLMDRTNARGDQMGMLPEALESYRDAFTGLLTSEPEMSGALTGTRTSRGKVPAYSTFGYGELFFPLDVAMKRLSSALAAEIITEGYLGDGIKEAQDNHRRLLIMSKQFVLSPAYHDVLAGFDRKKGAQIWKDFSPRTDLERESLAREHVSDMQRRYEDFERQTWPALQRELVAQREVVGAELFALLNVEIDRVVDASKDGLLEAHELLSVLINPAIALQADALGENPQNLVSELRRTEALLDQKLSVKIDNTRTNELLQKVNDLRSSLARLETTLRLLRPEEGPVMLSRVAAAGTELDPIPSEQTKRSKGAKTEAVSNEEYERTAAEIEATKLEIETSCVEYQTAMVDEDRASYQQRREAKEQARTASTEQITELEKHVTELADQLGHLRIRLDELQEERRVFLMRHFVWYPILGLIVLLIPFLASFLGIALAGTLIALLLTNTFILLTSIVLLAVPYTIAVLYLFLRGIDRQVKEARQSVELFEANLKAAIINLRRARNDRLRLEFDIYGQGLQIETFNYLIDSARTHSEKLKHGMIGLMESREAFVDQRERAIPASSMTRRTLLSPSDIDRYYAETVDDRTPLTNEFLEQLPRSQVPRLPMEEFRSRLEGFARERFSRLNTLTIEDVVLRERELVHRDEIPRKFHELDDAAQPLLQLRDIGVDGDVFAQLDVTLWAEGGEQVLDLYRPINPRASLRPSEDRLSLRTLSRCLNFPAYSVGQVEFFRACYDRLPIQHSQELPDVIPDQLTLGADVRKAYEQLLLAVALGVVQQTDVDLYTLEGQGVSLTGDRRAVAEKMANEFALQAAYNDMLERVKNKLSNNSEAFARLSDFVESAQDLNAFERDMLNSFVQKHNPLR